MKKFFSFEALFVVMLIMSFNSILFAQSKYFQLDATKMHDELSFLRNSEKSYILKLPIADGGWMNFKITENNTLSDEFKLESPEILSFDIIAVDDPSYHGTLTMNNEKLYATIMTKNGMMGIWPSKSGERNKYKVYYGSNDPEIGHQPIICEQDDSPRAIRRLEKSIAKIGQRDTGTNGDEMKTFRLVVISTGEFYIANGSSTTAVRNLIVAVVNGWNVILKNDLAVELVLARSPFVYTNKATDPFIPDGAGGNSRTTQAVDVINSKFNKSIYDIGHVMHNHHPDYGNEEDWGNGGLAGLGVVCSNSTYFGTTGGPNKAAGWSGSYHNEGNDYIQLSVHEVGHQFDMTHTFNGTGGSCTDNITDYTSYEIGSGTTIMSYNGICRGDQNIPASGILDNYYHTNSIERALAYINDEVSCAATSVTGNTPPVVDAGKTYIIPRRTPFMLTGEAFDADGDEITYCWEQYDEDGDGHPTQGRVGFSAASHPLAPLFRSYPPTSDSYRYFPHMSYILDGNTWNLPYEALPSVARTMNFRLIVRDNNLNGGGVAWDETIITVDATAASFKINSQNTDKTYTANGTNTFEITWSIGKTDQAPISCSEVEIYFSCNGGKTFPFLLGTTANDGVESILVPNLPTVEGRMMLKAVDNIFFDVNNKDIKVLSTCKAIGTSFVPDEDVEGEDNSMIDENLNLDLEPVYGMDISKFSGDISANDIASKLVYENGGSCVVAGNDVYYDIYKFYVTSSGYYKFINDGAYGLVMNLYDAPYSDFDLCLNMISTSAHYDGGNVTLNNYLSANLLVGKAYYMRVSSFSLSTPSTLPASYSITLKNKPTGSKMYDNVAPPSVDYSYFFVAYNNENNMIASISKNSDYRYLNSGVYTVKGASVSVFDSTLFKSYVGDNINTLLNLVVGSDICANFSSNSIQVTVYGSSCVVNDAGLTDVRCYDNGTNMDPSDDFIGFSLNPLDIPDTSIYVLLVSGGLVVTPDTANFDIKTDFSFANGSAGDDEIYVSVLYGEDCEFPFVITNPGTCSDCVNAEANINEFHYDNAGADENEFVEIFIANPQPDSLHKYIVALYNGSNGEKYDEETLNNMTANVGDNGMFYVWEPSSIQNGGPDGVALVGECGNVLEFLSYEGDIIATNGYANGMASVDIGVEQDSKNPKDGSLQLIDSVWIKTIAFNTKGAINETGPCSIIFAEEIDLKCFDNSTTSNPTDDYLTFELNPIGNQLEGNYNISINSGTITPATASFGVNGLFTLNEGSAGGGDVIISINSENIDTCSYEFIISDPGSCSPDCILNTSGLTDVKCNNNGTPDFAGDDQITISLNPTGYNTTSTYIVSTDNTTVQPVTGDFGMSTIFNFGNGSAGSGDIVITINDNADIGCEIIETVIDPGVCSTSAVNDIGKDHVISIFPNPATDILKIKTEVSNISVVKVVDHLGKIILNDSFNDKIDISQLNQGAYYILFYNNKNVLVDAHQFLKY